MSRTALSVEEQHLRDVFGVFGVSPKLNKGQCDGLQCCPSATPIVGGGRGLSPPHPMRTSSIHSSVLCTCYHFPLGRPMAGAPTTLATLSAHEPCPVSSVALLSIYS